MSTDIVADVVLDDPLLPLSFERRYAQTIGKTNTYENSIAPGSDIFHSALGNGWTHNFNEHLIFDAPQYYKQYCGRYGDDSIMWVGPAGESTYLYTWPIAPPSTDDGDVRWGDLGHMNTITSGISDLSKPSCEAARTYWLTQSDGTIKQFVRPQGSKYYAYLSKITTGGMTIELTYYSVNATDPDCHLASGGGGSQSTTSSEGMLCKVATPGGRQFKLQYDSQRRLQALLLPTGNPNAPFVAQTVFGWNTSDCQGTLGPAAPYPSGSCNGNSLCCSQSGSRALGYYYDNWQSNGGTGQSRLFMVRDAEGTVLEWHDWYTSDQVRETDSPDAHNFFAYGSPACSAQINSTLTDICFGLGCGEFNYYWPSSPPVDGAAFTLKYPSDQTTLQTLYGTQVVEWAKSGTAYCEHFDEHGYLHSIEETGPQCGCGGSEFHYGPIPYRGLDKYSQVVPWGHAGRQLESIKKRERDQSNGERYTLYDYEHDEGQPPHQRKRKIIDNAVSGILDVAHPGDDLSEWTRLDYWPFPADYGRGQGTPTLLPEEQGASLVKEEWHHSVQDGNNEIPEEGIHRNRTYYDYQDTGRWPRLTGIGRNGATWSVDQQQWVQRQTTTQFADDPNTWAHRTTNVVETQASTSNNFFPWGSGDVNLVARLASSAVTVSGTANLTTTYGDGAAECGVGGYDVFGHPRTVRGPDGLVSCFSYDNEGRLLATWKSADPVASLVSFTYTRDGRPSTVSTTTGVVQAFYGGGRVSAARFQAAFGSAGLPTATERWAIDPETSTSQLLSRTETLYTLPGVHGNKAWMTRTAVTIPGEQAPCTLPSHGSCRSDADCDDWDYCVQDESGGKCVEATEEAQACPGSFAQLCRHNVCMQLSSQSTYDYDNQGEVSNVKTLRRAGYNDDPDFPPSVTETSMMDEGPYRYTTEMSEYRTEQNETKKKGTKTSYDLQWRPTKVEYYTDYPTGTPQVLATMEHLLNGEVRTTSYEYDVNGYEKQHLVTTRTYDDFGQLVKVQTPDAGLVQYQYDSEGRVTRRKAADGGVTIYAYDLAGRLTQVTYPQMPGESSAATVTYTYDVMGGQSAFSGAPDDCASPGYYGWTPPSPASKGRLTTIEDKEGARRFYYDAKGRLAFKQERRNYETCYHVSAWTYDDAGRVIEQRYPSGRFIRYDYTGSQEPNLPSRVSTTINGTEWDIATDIQYVDGRVSKYKSPTGYLNASEVDLMGAPTSRTTTDPLDRYLLSRTVTSVNRDGSPLTVDGEINAANETYEYTPQGTLKHAKTKAGAPYSEISYDVGLSAEANRTTVTQFVAANDMCIGQQLRTSNYEYVPGTNQLQKVTAGLAGGAGMTDVKQSNFEYDNRGNVSQITQSSCDKADPGCNADYVLMATHDAEGRLVKWRKWDWTAGPSVTPTLMEYQYGYDDRWLRTYKKNLGTGERTSFYYADGGQLLSESRQPSDAQEAAYVRDYIWLGGSVVGFVDSRQALHTSEDDSAGAVYYVHSGFLGEALRITDNSGEIVWFGDHDPFGTRNPTGTNTLTGGYALGLPGQYSDSETGMTYNWHRYYNSQIGRYMEADPLRASGADLPSFGYANGNPLVFTDPTGLLILSNGQDILKSSDAALVSAMKALLNDPNIGPQVQALYNDPSVVVNVTHEADGSDPNGSWSKDFPGTSSTDPDHSNSYIDVATSDQKMAPFSMPPAPLDVYLAHELGHDASFLLDHNPPNSGHQFPQKAMDWENARRIANKLPPRDRHGRKDPAGSFSCPYKKKPQLKKFK